MQTKSAAVMLPREHGAWAMFIVPLIIGIGAGGQWDPNLLPLALTAFGFFLLRYPLMLLVKSRSADARSSAARWSTFYAALAAASGIWLLLSTQLWPLIPIGALGFLSLATYLWLAARRAEMSLAGEWIGIAGLALGAPSAYLVATHAFDTTAIVLYLLNVLYFGGTVFYIKFKVREQPRVVAPTARWLEKLWVGRVTILYHAMALIIVTLLALIGTLPALAAAAFALPTCKAIGGVTTRPARLNIPRLGFIELGVTVVFALVVVAAYR